MSRWHRQNFPCAWNPNIKQQRVVLEVPGAQLWSPQTPHLYQLAVSLTDANGYGSQIEAHFGLRKIEARGRYIYLNNEAVYLDGFFYQPGTATYKEMKRHMYAIKALGCNLVRVHIAGIDPRIYTLADQIGINGNWSKPVIASFSSAKGEWKDIDPVFSPDGKIVLFQSTRLVENCPNRMGFDIWAVTK